MLAALIRSRPCFHPPRSLRSSLLETRSYSVAAEAADGAAGIVYRRTDELGGKPYIGQVKSDERFVARPAEHARAKDCWTG